MYARSIHWFRRDLRVSDNVALREASKQSQSVIPAYFISDWSGSHLWTGPARQQFLCGCLESLERNLATLGGRLIYRRGPAIAELRKLIRDTKAEALFINRDPDPFGRETENSVATLCRELGVACHTCKDVVLHEPGEVLKQDNSAYRVYTPYSRRWHQLEKPRSVPKPLPLSTPTDVSSRRRPSLKTWGLSETEAEIVTPGELPARTRLKEALRDRLSNYSELRDHPSSPSTSRLSQDLRFGTISIRKVYWDTHKALHGTCTTPRRVSLEKFLKELAWREFYMQILAHFPEVLELEFNPDWRGLPWDEPGPHFDAWKQGETGFPIIDAGMRELAATGFMHNRVRMIVAMFLTKDLHLDWRLGEQFFMQSLIDGEIASNNGGWQWSAGTGADAAPYFRIQNPWTQTKRYDPDGGYIRKWVPELTNTPAKALYTDPKDGSSIAPGYPAPIVDHGAERARTLAIFKRHATQRAR